MAVNRYIYIHWNDKCIYVNLPVPPVCIRLSSVDLHLKSSNRICIKRDDVCIAFDDDQGVLHILCHNLQLTTGSGPRLDGIETARENGLALGEGVWAQGQGKGERVGIHERSGAGLTGDAGEAAVERGVPTVRATETKELNQSQAQQQQQPQQQMECGSKRAALAPLSTRTLSSSGLSSSLPFVSSSVVAAPGVHPLVSTSRPSATLALALAQSPPDRANVSAATFSAFGAGAGDKENAPAPANANANTTAFCAAAQAHSGGGTGTECGGGSLGKGPGGKPSSSSMPPEMSTRAMEPSLSLPPSSAIPSTNTATLMRNIVGQHQAYRAGPVL